MKDRSKPIKGVVCDVHNCAYNDGNCSCTASQISVGPQSAEDCKDTVCATFKGKEE